MAGVASGLYQKKRVVGFEFLNRVEESKGKKRRKNDAHKCPVSVVFSKALTIPLGCFVYIVS